MPRKLLEVPAGLNVSGSATTAVTVCTLTPALLNAGLTGYLLPTNYAVVDGYIILLDGTAIGTAPLVVTVGLLNFQTGTYIAPATIWGPNSAGVTNPVTVTNATAQVVNIPGAWPSVQVSIASFGTSTGTFRAMIQAY